MSPFYTPTMTPFWLPLTSGKVDSVNKECGAAQAEKKQTRLLGSPWLGGQSLPETVVNRRVVDTAPLKREGEDTQASLAAVRRPMQAKV